MRIPRLIQLCTPRRTQLLSATISILLAFGALTAALPRCVRAQEFLTLPQNEPVPTDDERKWHFPWSRWTDKPSVGSAQWWKDNKDDAVFEPGKGYKLEGVDGYFDQAGRPLDRAVTMGNTPHPDGGTEEPKGLIPGLDPRITYGKVRDAVGLGPDDQVAHEYLMKGEELFEAQKYRPAAKAYDKAADRAIDMRLKEDAMFMKAESYFFNDMSIKARDAYDALAQKYPSTRYLDKLVARQWAIAQYLEKKADYNYDLPMTPNAWDKTRPWFDTMGHAIKTYENIRMNDPTGPRADDALMATANVYFRSNRFDDADYHYTLLRREYPRSEFQFEAHLLGLQSKLRKYQGQDYDGAPLEEAQMLVKQLRTNFAGQLSADERERLKTVGGQLHQELANRDMTMARHYDKGKHYGAAKTYYAEVIRKYPSSTEATTARERLAAIGGEPDSPPKRLAWFVEQFPQSEEHSAIAKVPEIRDGTLIARRAQSADGTAPTTTASPAPAATTR
jgi:outer membrane protein assembly factor BamD (BamD/ComL family)